MVGADNTKPKPGDRVTLTAISPGLSDGLPGEDQQAIAEIVGKTITLNGYEEVGRAELEFKDCDGNFHFIYVRPDSIKKAI